MAPSVAATFCATLVDEWARAGCTDAVVAPGSRSTPLALALLADRRIRVHVFHDERPASFAALGMGAVTGRPAVLVCTSGTAATHFHGAVAEADLSGVPIVVCTADRPPELWQVGAPQTIDQTRLYGPAVRLFAQPGVPDEESRPAWRSLAARSVVEALGSGGRPGPVHLNLSFRDPLVGTPGELPPGRPEGQPWHRVEPLAPLEPAPSLVEEVAALLDGRPGVIVAGAGVQDPAGVGELAERLGWPVLADHRSRCRALPAAIGHADPLLRAPGFARQRRPEVVLRLGEPHSSKVLGRWLAAAGAVEIGAERHGSWWDPDRALSLVVRAEPGRLARCVAPRVAAPPAGELEAWRSADALAADAIRTVVDGAGAPTEPGVARAALDATTSGGALVVASSMPVRDLEWFGGRRSDVLVQANRGANGIDGVISTAIGVALTGRPTVCLLGDVAFLHDSTALTGLVNRPVDLTVVVVDNDGGGIFSFLPQASQVPADRFETLFGTPHGVDLPGLAAAHRIPVTEAIGDQHQVLSVLRSAVAAGGARMVWVRTNRSANVEFHHELERAVVAAVD